MKKLDNIYDKITAKENLYSAANLAQRTRRYRPTSADFNFCLEQEIESLHMELSSKTYRHGLYRQFMVYEPKQRMISAAPFRDRVVHHAVHDIIEPLIDPSFIYDSYACRRGKGTHKAVDRAQSFLRANRFCLHGDIRKYFPSIDTFVLKNLIRKRIQDAQALWLLDEIIDSAQATGLPIGNLTSQFFANLYLNELDHFVKHELRMPYYIRYMDDFLVFANTKNLLQKTKNTLRVFLRQCLRLRLHEEKTQIHKTVKGIKFLGFRLYNRFRRLTAQNVRFFRKRLRLYEFLFIEKRIKQRCLEDSVRSWTAHSNCADTSGLRIRILNEVLQRNTRVGNVIQHILMAQPLSIVKADIGRESLVYKAGYVR
jgi:retron-type reverse transcriptase